MFPRSGLFLHVLLILASATASAAEKTVNALGDLDRIEFVGNQAYSTAQLRAGLAEDLEILVAGRSEGELDQWLKILQARILIGYQIDGFAKAKASVRLDDVRGVIVVDLNEGSQYLCGAIEIVGAKTLPVDKFRELMSITRVERTQQPNQAPIPPDLPPKDTSLCRPLWVKGKTAKCAYEYWKTRKTSFQYIFKALGYFDPTFVVWPRIEEDMTATLVVDIQDEGTRSSLDRFDITGLTKNSPEDLIGYLNLPLGTPLDLDVKRQIERKLWDSARFLHYHVEIVPRRAAGVTQTTVKIIATECDDAPSLLDSLSAEQAAFLRLFQWLAAISEAKEDLEAVMSMSSAVFADTPAEKTENPDANNELPEDTLFLKCRAIFSPQNKAVFASCEIADKSNKTLLGYAVHMKPNRLTIDSVANRIRFEIRDFDAKLVLNLDWSYVKGEERPERIMMAAGYGTRRSTSAPLLVHAVLPPVLALKLFKTDVHTLQLDDKLASIDLAEGIKFSFNRQTGVVQNFKISEGTESLDASCREGIYEEFIAKYEESMAGVKVIGPGETPVTAFIGFLVESTKDSPVPRLASLSQLGQRIVERGALRGLDGFVNRVQKYFLEKDHLWIPDDSPTKLVRDHSYWITWLQPMCDAILPDQELTRKLSRELVLSRVMRGYQESASFAEAFGSGKSGPVTDLIARLAFESLGSNAPKVIQSKGPDEVTRTAFQRDCELLLNDDWALGQFLLGLTAALQQSDEDEVDALVAAASLLAAGAQMLRPLLALITEQRDKTPREALIAIFDTQWETALRPGLAAMFQHAEADDSPKPMPPEVGQEVKPSSPLQR